MMKPGPLPIPTALKIAAGNPGHRPLNRNEPRLDAHLPPPPKHLSGAAKVFWRKTGRLLLGAGVITRLDEAAFGALCEAYAQYAGLIVKARDNGPVVKVNGQLVPNPYLVEARKQFEIFRRLTGEFGLTPSSRARVQMRGPTEEEREIEEFNEYLREGRKSA